MTLIFCVPAVAEKSDSLRISLLTAAPGGQASGAKGTTRPCVADKTDGAAIRRNRISAPPRDGYFE